MRSGGLGAIKFTSTRNLSRRVCFRMSGIV